MQTMVRGALIVVLATCASLASARVAQDYAFDLFKAGRDARYSDDVFEDGQLDTPDLIRKYRYPVEVHSVTTEDGYILEMHRIPHGRDQNNVPDPNKPVVFLMHGLSASSPSWIIMGPGHGLGYILAEEGYDVWMGNARGNTYSRRHIRLNPDSTSLLRTSFWDFSWDEIGHYDLPAMIDYALKHTGKQKLHYIGHSQGTTAFFVMGSLRPEYNNKIISMQALAPVAYMANNQMPLLQFISPHANNIERIAALLGVGEFLPNRDIYTWAGQAMCRDEVVTQALCSNIIFLIGGWNEAQHNATMLPTIYGHCPAGAAVRQLVHYGQGISGKEFRRYDHGDVFSNIRAYGRARPPHYDTTKITAPVFMHYTDNDQFAHVDDVDRLFRELPRSFKFRVPLATFSHVDFIWAIDVRELLYNRVLNLMAAVDANTFDETNIDKY